MAWLGLYRPDAAPSSVSWPSSSTCPSWRSRTRSRPTSGRSSSATATRCSSSSRPPATSTRPRRSSSASCTCSSARDFVDHRAAQRVAGPLAGAAAAGERPGAAGPGHARRCSTRSWTPSSTGTRRWSPAWRTTSTRSRSRSSAATRGVSRRIYELSREVVDFQRAAQPLTGILGRDHRRVRQVRRRRGAAQLPARRRRPRHAGHRAGGRLPAAAARHPHGERDARRAAAERGDPRAHRGQHRAGRGGQEDLRVGGHPVRARPWSARSTG